MNWCCETWKWPLQRGHFTFSSLQDQNLFDVWNSVHYASALCLPAYQRHVVGNWKWPLQCGHCKGLAIFSESAPLPEHHPYISFDFLSFLFLWTDFYSPCQTPWSNFVRFSVHLYSLPYHTTFPLSGLVPRPRRWLE